MSVLGGTFQPFPRGLREVGGARLSSCEGRTINRLQQALFHGNVDPHGASGCFELHHGHYGIGGIVLKASVSPQIGKAPQLRQRIAIFHHSFDMEGERFCSTAQNFVFAPTGCDTARKIRKRDSEYSGLFVDQRIRCRHHMNILTRITIASQPAGRSTGAFQSGSDRRRRPTSPCRRVQGEHTERGLRDPFALRPSRPGAASQQFPVQSGCVAKPCISLRNPCATLHNRHFSFKVIDPRIEALS